MRKRIITALLIMLLSALCFADSLTFDTYIDSVSGGQNGFGLGLFPLGTSFSYVNYVPLLNDNFPQTKFNISMEFGYSSTSLAEYYTYDKGIPYWSMTVAERNRDYSDKYLSGEYFNPKTNIYLYVQQGFGTNPVSGTGSLVDLRLSWNTRYSMALEGNPFISSVDSLLFVNPDGSPKAPFGPNSSIHSMPWLQGNRMALNNNIGISSYWHFDKWTGTDAYDGLYGELSFEYGPAWLANTLSPKSVQSNYYKTYAYLEEKLTLFSNKQDDGKNWTTMYIGHSNSFSHVGGNVVPENKIPGDRLRNTLTDSIWLHFAGPQFIAGDCYSFIEIGISNKVYWGNVVNELINQTKAIELISDIYGLFHLRLFGFIRFEYSFGYSFIRGISASDPKDMSNMAAPGWWQNAELRFYVSV